MNIKKVQYEDFKAIGNLEFVNIDKFKNSTFLITGATGLIGSNLVGTLALNNIQKNLNIQLILPVRNVDVATRMFGWTKADIIPYKLEDTLEIPDTVDYIVHLASPTDSLFFLTNPVDTMSANIEGYKTLLEWARMHPVKKFIGLSTMEVYGMPEKGHLVNESELGAFETMNARNSYPISKIACEALCNSYYVQYGVPAVILRATQTFGPGVKYADKRVFAQFMRCAIEKRNIVLKSTGMTERPYLYTADAVSAILVSLLNATPGEAYTVANPDTYCSIKEMAELVADDISNGEIKVVFDIADDIEKLGYAQTLHMNLSVKKLMKLGWVPQVDLKTMYIRMIRGVEEDDKRRNINEYV